MKLLIKIIVITCMLAACGGGGGSGTTIPANVAPVANAGIVQSVFIGSVVTLDGSGSSDGNNDALTYNWALTSKPNGSSAVLLGEHTVMPTFTPDVAGAYVFNLIVNDGKVNSTVASTVTVNATPVITMPSISLAGTYKATAFEVTYDVDHRTLTSTDPSVSSFSGTWILRSDLTSDKTLIENGVKIADDSYTWNFNPTTQKLQLVPTTAGHTTSSLDVTFSGNNITTSGHFTSSNGYTEIDHWEKVSDSTAKIAPRQIE